MYRNCSILLLLLALLGATTSVSAFCIHNDSEQRLFFEVGDHGINYRKWIAAGSMSCCDWRQENCNWTHIAAGRLSVRLADQKLNGVAAQCSATVRADGNLRLVRFAPAQQCQWDL
jgi:hypothetical protein